MLKYIPITVIFHRYFVPCQADFKILDNKHCNGDINWAWFSRRRSNFLEVIQPIKILKKSLLQAKYHIKQILNEVKLDIRNYPIELEIFDEVKELFFAPPTLHNFWRSNPPFHKVGVHTMFTHLVLHDRNGILDTVCFYNIDNYKQ